MENSNITKRERLYNNLIGTGKVNEQQIGTKDQFLKALSTPEKASKFYNRVSSIFSPSEIGGELEFLTFLDDDYKTPEHKDQFSAQNILQRTAPAQTLPQQIQTEVRKDFAKPDNTLPADPANRLPEQKPVQFSDNTVQQTVQVPEQVEIKTPDDAEKELQSLTDSTKDFMSRYNNIKQRLQGIYGEGKLQQGKEARIGNFSTLFSAAKVSPQDRQFFEENREKAAEIEDRTKALMLQKDLLKLNENLKTYDDTVSGLAKFWNGLTNTGLLKDFTTLGMTEIERNFDVASIAEKDPALLTKEERDMLNIYKDFQALNEGKKSFWHTAGASSQKMAHFITNIVAGNFAFAGLREGMRQGIGIATREALKGAAKKQIAANIGKKIGESAIFNLVVTPTRTTFYEELSKGAIDQDKSALKNVYESTMRTFWEYFAEEFSVNLGSHGAALLESRSLNQVLGKYAKNLSKVTGNKWYQATKNILDKAQIGNVPVEMGEEVLTNLGNALTLLSQEDFNQLKDADFYKSIAVSTIFFQGAMLGTQSAAGGVGNRIERNQTKREAQKAVDNLTSLSPDLPSPIQQRINSLITNISEGNIVEEKEDISGSPVLADISALTNEVEKSTLPQEQKDNILQQASRAVTNSARAQGVYAGIEALAEKEMGGAFGHKKDKKNVYIITDRDDKKYYLIDHQEGEAGSGIEIVRPVEGGEITAQPSIDFTDIQSIPKSEFIDGWLSAREQMQPIQTVEEGKAAIAEEIEAQAEQPLTIEEATPGTEVLLGGEKVIIDRVSDEGIQLLDQEGGIHYVDDISDLQRIPQVVQQELPTQETQPEQVATPEANVVVEQQPVQQPQVQEQKREIPLTKDGEPDYDAMSPDMLFEELSKVFPAEKVSSILTGFADNLQKQIVSLRKKNTKSLNDEIKKEIEIISLTDRLFGLHAVINPVQPVQQEQVAPEAAQQEQIISQIEQEQSEITPQEERKQEEITQSQEQPEQEVVKEQVSVPVEPNEQQQEGIPTEEVVKEETGITPVVSEQVEYTPEERGAIDFFEGDLPNKKPEKGNKVYDLEIIRKRNLNIKPRPVNIKQKPVDEALKNFINKKDIRPTMLGILNDKENNVKVATDANILGVFPDNITGSTRIISSLDGKVIEGQYPSYRSVIPLNSLIIKADAQELLDKANGIMWANKFVTNDHSIFARIPYNGIGIYFSSDFLVKAIKGLMEVGVTKLEIRLPDTPNKAIIVYDAKNNKRFTLIMPIQASESIHYSDIITTPAKRDTKLQLENINVQIQTKQELLEKKNEDLVKAKKEDSNISIEWISEKINKLISEIAELEKQKDEILNQNEQSDTKGVAVEKVNEDKKERPIGTQKKEQKAIIAETERKIALLKQNEKTGLEEAKRQQVIGKQAPAPTRELGNGAKVYFETDKYRVNDNSTEGGYLLNINDNTNSVIPMANMEFSNLEDAMFAVNLLNKRYPNGVPEAVLVEKYIQEELKKSKEEYDSQKRNIAKSKEPWQMTREELRDDIREQGLRAKQGETIQFDDFDADGMKEYKYPETIRLGNNSYTILYNGSGKHKRGTQMEFTNPFFTVKGNGLDERIFISGGIKPIHINKIIKEIHKNEIQQAVSEGKNVPEEVLKDYPELQLSATEIKEESKPETSNNQQPPIDQDEEVIPEVDGIDVDALAEVDEELDEDNKDEAKRLLQQAKAKEREQHKAPVKIDERTTVMMSPERAAAWNEEQKITTQEPEKEVVMPDFSKDISLEAAKRAFYNISYDPDKRGKQLIDDYITTIADIYNELNALVTNTTQRKILDTRFEEFRKGLINKYNAYISAKSRTASPMITGPARFPVERNRKAMESEMKRYDELVAYKDRSVKNITKSIESALTPEEKQNKRLEEVRKKAEAIRDDIDFIINGLSSEKKGVVFPYNKNLLKNSVAIKIMNLAIAGDIEAAEEIVKYTQNKSKESGISPLFTQNHKVYKVIEQQKNKPVEQIKEKGPLFTFVEQKHTKTGEDLFTVKLNERVERDEYDRLNDMAKSNNGRYSSWNKGGAIPGFVFKSEVDRDNFIKNAFQESESVLYRDATLPETISINGVEKPTRNSEGNFIHPTEEGIINFYEWFGDSQMIDANGCPIVFYHGTNNQFNAFDIDKMGSSTDAGWLGEGFYFYTDRHEASQYGKIGEYYLKINEPYYASDEENEMLAEQNNKESSKEFSDNLKNEGYDGVYYNGNLRGETVVFSPAQIKSATDNTGTFDPENPDIRYRQPYFYSPTEQALNVIKQEKATPEQWKAMLLKNGAKEAEMDWMQFDDLFGNNVQHELKEKQLDVILRTNPMSDDIHTGIRSIDDIKTFDEVIDDLESFVWGDFSKEDAEKALKDGTITIYSSKPITNGVFVSTSKNQAKDYAGDDKVYSKSVKVNDVAWINGDEGQYAEIPKTKTITKSEIQDWINQNRIEVQEVEKGNFGELEKAKQIFENYGYELLADVYTDVDGNDHIYEDEVGYINADGDFVAYDELPGNLQEVVDNLTKTTANTKYSQYQEPGGENYKELLLTIPEIGSFIPYGYEVRDNNGELIGHVESESRAKELSEKSNGTYEAKVQRNPKDQFKSSHFDEPNILAHIRFNERTINGERVLFIEEIQSDWAQTGKKEGFKNELAIKAANDFENSLREKYGLTKNELIIGNNKVPFREQRELSGMSIKNNNATPDMPFKNTDQWVNLALRRMMIYAAENGFDRIAWTNGEQQAARYDLSKSIKEIEYSIDPYLISQKDNLPMYKLKARDKNDNPVIKGEYAENELENIVGKELAKKIVNGEGKETVDKTKSLTGLDLKVGGEGMKTFYDNIIPAQANKVGKKFGAKVETFELPELGAVQSIPITDAIREQAQIGMPLFSIIGEKGAKELDMTNNTTLIINNSLISLQSEALLLAETLNTPVRIISDIADIPATKVMMRKAKGFYNPKTDEVSIVLPNNKSVADVQATILHEAVAHKGLRGLLGEQFKPAMERVFTSMPTEARADYLAKYGEKVTAAEEYLASIAEKDINPTLWQKIVSIIRDAFRALGIDLKLTNADMAYLLWRSKNRLKNADTATTIEVVNDIGKANEARERLRVAFSQKTTNPFSEIALNPLKKDYELTENNEWEFGYDLMESLGRRPASPRFDYIKVGDAIVRVKGHEPNWNNFIDDIIDLDVKGILNITLGNYNKGRYHDNKIPLDKFQEKHPDIDIINIDVKDGESLSEVLNIIKNELVFKNKEDFLFRDPDILDQYIDTNDLKLTTLDKRIADIQDRMIAVKRLTDEVKKRGGNVSFFKNPYETEILSTSKSKAVMDVFGDEYMKPITDIVKDWTKRGIKDTDRWDYMIAKHAPERNKVITSREVFKYITGRMVSPEEKEYLADKSNRAMFHRIIGNAYDNVFYGDNLMLLSDAIGEEFLMLNMVQVNAIARFKNIKGSKQGNIRSGMSDQEAAGIVKEFESKLNAGEAEGFWSLVRNATRFALSESVKHQLISTDTYNDMLNMYQYYVPLRGWKEKEGLDYTGIVGDNYLGSSIINPVNKQAQGRESKAEDPLAYIPSMAESAIVSGNKNEIRLAAWRMVEANRDMSDLFLIKDAWQINIAEPGEEPVWETTFEPPEQYLIDAGLARKARTNNTYNWHKTREQLKNHQVPVFVNGQYVVMEFKGNIGISVAKAINGSGITGMDAFHKSVSSITRTMAALSTSKNPDFMLTNFLRDAQFGLTAYYVRGGNPLALVANLPSAWKEIHKNYFGVGKETEGQGLYGKFREYGGETGWVHINNVDEHKKRLANMIKEANQAQNGSPVLAAKKVGRAVNSTLEYLAVMSENAMRFAAFKTEIERMTKDGEPITAEMYNKAAISAKELTTNFNRKGEWSKYAGAYWAFFNASVQGTANTIRLAQENPARFVVAQLGLMMFRLLGPALIFAIGGDDDKEAYDELNQYVKDNYAIFPSPFESGKFITIPLPHGHRATTSIASIIFDGVRGKNNKPVSDYLKNIISEASPWNIVGLDKSTLIPETLSEAALTVMPTWVKPIAEASYNLDFLGNTIEREPILTGENNVKPRFVMAKSTTNTIFVGAAKTLNRLAGGRDDVSARLHYNKESGQVEESRARGWFDMSPALLEHIFEGYLGGVGRFLNDTYKTTSSLLGGEAPKMQNIPVVRRLYMEPYSDVAWQTYYDTKKRVLYLDTYMKSFEKVRDRNGFVGINSFHNNRIIGTFDIYDKLIRDLRKSYDSLPEGDSQRDEIDNRIEDTVQKLHEEIKKIDKMYNTKKR